ncbi:hypothetical protein OH492_20175 [Vibrio chagasii]|nr:hypothetical protein [Vibrio chagasii]
MLGDGVNSLIAAVFNTFPNTTFSQNNGVIHYRNRKSLHWLLHCGDSFSIGSISHLRRAVVNDDSKTSIRRGNLGDVRYGCRCGYQNYCHEKLDRRRIMTIAISLGLGLE